MGKYRHQNSVAILDYNMIIFDNIFYSIFLVIKMERKTKKYIL